MSISKKVKRIFLGIIIALIIVIAVIYFAANAIIASGIRSFGTKLTGTKVDVSSVSLSPFSGTLEINNFSVDNPSGYLSKQALSISKFYVNVEIGTITKDDIIINKILIDDIKVDFEPSLTEFSNLNKIESNIENNSASSEAASQTSNQTESSQKRIVIKEFVINNGNISISSSMLKSTTNVIFPKLQINNIGAQNSLTPSEAVEKIFSAMMDVIITAAGNVPGIDLDTLSSDGNNIGSQLKSGIQSLGSSLGLQSAKMALCWHCLPENIIRG